MDTPTGLLDDLLRSSVNAVVCVDESQTITLFSGGAERMFGYAAAEALGRKLDLLLPPGVVERHRAHVACFAHSEEKSRRMGERSPVRARRKDGTEFPADVSISKFVSMDGLTLTAVLRDISDSVMAADKLAEGEALLRLAQQAGGVGSWEWRAPTDRGIWSDVTWGIFQPGGYGEASFEMWRACLHPGDRARATANVRQALETGGSYNDEYRVVHGDGSVHWLRVAGEVIRDASGEPSVMRGIVVDISERKRAEEALRESEELYRNTLQALPAQIAVIEADGRIMAINQTGVEFAAENGADKNPLVREGVNYLDVCRAAAGKDEDAARALAGVGDVLAGARPAFTMEYACQSPQEERWFSMTVVPLESGGRRGAVIAHSDITDRKRAEAVLTNANEKLEERVAERTAALRMEMKRREDAQADLAESQRLEAIGKLTGGVAHDANNMLTVISGNLEMLEDALGAGAPGLKYLREAQAAAERMTQLNRRLLTVARRRKLAPRVLDLNQQVAAMSDMLRRVLGETVTLTTTLHSGIWRVALDASELDAALLNLAINARDAMPRGGRLHISTKNVEIDEEATRGEVDLTPGKYVSISVTDSGDGIPPEVLPRVFEPFFTTKGQGKGTGLGLATVHGFTKQSGGHVTIYSEQGRGTTVNVYFPRHEGVDTTTGETQRLVKDAVNGTGETVLVVEDDAQVRAITCARLERLGYHVLEAPDGPSALALLQAGAHVDLVFSDIVMSGGMSGFDLMSALDDRAPNLPVLLTSGFDLDAVRNGERQFSAKVLQKPYSQYDLAETVKAALARARA